MSRFLTHFSCRARSWSTFRPRKSSKPRPRPCLNFLGRFRCNSRPQLKEISFLAIAFRTLRTKVSYFSNKMTIRNNIRLLMCSTKNFKTKKWMRWMRRTSKLNREIWPLSRTSTSCHHPAPVLQVSQISISKNWLEKT